MHGGPEIPGMAELSFDKRFIQGHFRMSPRLTLGSTRTPPAMSPTLSQLPASSAPLSASAQAGPVSLVR